MENQTNLKISIPKPCHEDWNKFTPDEKGAFCKVCSKSVHDFTKKTVEEISTILIDEMSAGKKVCGRFNEDQLEAATPALKGEMQDVVQLDAYSLNFTRLKKFALALFLVFGTYLFSTPKTYAQKMGKVAYIPRPEPIKGEIAPRYVEPKDSAKADTTKTPAPKVSKCTTMKGDVAIEPRQIMGGLRAVPVEEPKAVLGQAVVKPEVKTIETTPEVKDSSITIEDLMDINIKEPLNEDSTVEEDVVEMGEPMIMGLIAMPPDTLDMIVTPLVLIDSAQQTMEGELAVPESTFVETRDPAENKVLPIGEDLGGAPVLSSYPNPTSNRIITLRYNLKKDGMASISLFDLNGDLVKTLLPVQSLYASSYETRYDVSDLKDGIYFCELMAGQNKTTTRIVISK
jgi:hypothetical protein